MPPGPTAHVVGGTRLSGPRQAGILLGSAAVPCQAADGLTSPAGSSNIEVRGDFLRLDGPRVTGRNGPGLPS